MGRLSAVKSLKLNASGVLPGSLVRISRLGHRCSDAPPVALPPKKRSWV
jgi:hypothetical protein